MGCGGVGYEARGFEIEGVLPEVGCDVFVDGVAVVFEELVDGWEGHGVWRAGAVEIGADGVEPEGVFGLFLHVLADVGRSHLQGHTGGG